MTKNSFLLRTAGNSPFASSPSPSFGLLREFPDISRSGITLALLEIVEKKSFAEFAYTGDEGRRGCL
jgi:hypothetical protein